MNSLRLRLVLLCALIPILCTAVCAVAAHFALARNALAQEERRAGEALAAFDRRLRSAQLVLAEEAEARAAARDRDATGIRLARLIETARGDGIERVVVDRQVDEALARAPAIAAALRAAGPGEGVADCGGRPLLFAVRSVGDARSLALAPVTGTLFERLTVPGWTLVPPGETPPSADSQRQVARRMVEGPGGTTTFTLSSDQGETRRDWRRAQAAIVGVGLLTAALSTAVGGLLAWLWMRPLAALVAGCQRRARDPATALPRIADPEEIAVLSDSLRELLDSERRSRDALAQNLERESAVNAVHQRFLAQLAHEFAQPIRALTGTIELMRSQGGRLEPERLAEAHDAALRLEERFQEVLGLAADHVDRAAPQPRIAPARYLGDLAAILRPQAERLGVELRVEAPDEVVAVDARLLSPILVNLAANALRAMAAAPARRLTLRARVDAAGSAWMVDDSGPGIAEPLAARVAAACARGEVLPAEPGMGLGLALSLANARALGGTLRLARNGADGASFELALPPSTAERSSPG